MHAQPDATADFLQWADSQSGAFDDMEAQRKWAVEMLQKKLKEEGYLTDGARQKVEATEIAQKLHDAGLDWHGHGWSWREGSWSEQGWQWPESAWATEPSAAAEEWQEVSDWTPGWASSSSQLDWHRESNNKRDVQDIVEELRSRDKGSLSLADLPSEVLSTTVIGIEKLLIFHCGK